MYTGTTLASRSTPWQGSPLVKHVQANLHTVFGHQLQGLTIAVWGVSLQFTSGRDQPSIQTLIHALQDAGVHLKVHDPLHHHPAIRQHGHARRVHYIENRHATLTNADALVIWNPCISFASINIGLIHQQMNQPVIIDMCRQLDPAVMHHYGIRHYGIGYCNVTRQSLSARRQQPAPSACL